MLCNCSLCSAARQTNLAAVLLGILLDDEGQVDEGGAWQVTKHTSRAKPASVVAVHPCT